MSLNFFVIGIALLGLGQANSDPIGPSSNSSASKSSDSSPAAYEVLVGKDLKFTMPRDETLTYQANVEVAFVEAAVGEVVQVCKVEPYQRSLLLKAPDEDAEKERAMIEISAVGSYAVFDLRTTISSRHLPQAWPSITYTSESTGSKRRRRQNLIGVRDGKPTSSSRSDTKKGAAEGARIWKEPVYRYVPENTIDMLSAVLLTRTLVEDGLDELRFPMLEKDRLWEVVLTRGEEKRMRTRAGTFDVVEVLLQPGAYQGESIAEDKVEKFEGLFGIHGTIHLWVEKNTGVPVRIQGDIPAGPITLGVDVILKSFSGTPEGFKAVDKES